MVTKPQYIEMALLPVRSPNGSLWMLRGRLLYLRVGNRHQFMVDALGRRFMFGFGGR